MRTAGTEQRRTSARVRPAYWILLTAVVAGILGMHILSGSDAMDHQVGPPGPVATAMTHDMAVDDRSPAHPTPSADLPAVGTGPLLTSGTPVDVMDAMAACILFLAAGVAITAALAGRRAARGGAVAVPGQSALHALWRRGPPRWPSALDALGVSRI